MNKKTKFALSLKWSRFKYEMVKFYFNLFFGRWERDETIKIWEYEHE